MALKYDYLVSLGTDGDVLDRASDKLSETLAVCLRLRRQVFPLPGFGGGSHPTIELLVDGLCYLLQGRLGQIGDNLTIDPVGCTDLDLLKGIEYIELGKRKAGESVDPAGVVGGHGVEPAATAGPAGGGSILPADGSEFFSRLIQQFSHERTAAHMKKSLKRWILLLKKYKTSKELQKNQSHLKHQLVKKKILH